MIIKELKENEPLDVIKVYNHIKGAPASPGKENNQNIDMVESVKTLIFTDGEIEKESEEISEKIYEYKIGKKKYDYPVDTLKTKNVYFKNHSYVITCLVVKENTSVGNIGGWFDIIKDVTIYLEDSKNKTALKKAKKVIKEIINYNNTINFSSLLGMITSKGNGLEKFEPEYSNQNIYTLRRINKV